MAWVMHCMVSCRIQSPVCCVLILSPHCNKLHVLWGRMLCTSLEGEVGLCTLSWRLSACHSWMIILSVAERSSGCVVGQRLRRKMNAQECNALFISRSSMVMLPLHLTELSLCQCVRVASVPSPRSPPVCRSKATHPVEFRWLLLCRVVEDARLSSIWDCVTSAVWCCPIFECLATPRAGVYVSCFSVLVGLAHGPARRCRGSALTRRSPAAVVRL